MKKGKLLAVSLAAVVACGATAAFAGCKETGGATTFSWWMVSGDPFYYMDYEDNPVLKYISENVQFEDSNGEMQNINFEFEIPASTEAARNNWDAKMQNPERLENVLDPTMAQIGELYENDIIIDLTPYVTDPEIMPNLSAYLEANPDMASLLTTIVMEDGEYVQKYLGIPSIYAEVDDEQQSFGFNYRRDWLLKYGTQPDYYYSPMGAIDGEEPVKQGENSDGGQPFEGGHFTVNNDGTERNDPVSLNTDLPEGANGLSWEDDLLFPSGFKTPVYISDWQWMFEIYEVAMAEEGIEDSYMISQFYPGYNANGDLVSGFGGGGVLWYKEEVDGKTVAKFGATETGFRAYLECMRNWYEEGWLDNSFNSNTSAFYEIDNADVGHGLIPMWMGGSDRIGTRMVSDVEGFEHTQGAIVSLCAMPINDIPSYDGNPSTDDYSVQATEEEAEEAIGGGDGSEYMLQIPTCLYQSERAAGGIAITKKTAEEKDLILLLRFFDYLFSEEGSKLITLGLSAEQAADSEMYLTNGLSGGAYTDNGDGTYTYVKSIEEGIADIRTAMTGLRLPGLKCNNVIRYTYPETYQYERAQWTKYEATGFVQGLIGNQRTTEETELIEDVRLNLESNYMYRNVYKFITGEWGLDNASWISYCSSIASFNYRGQTVEGATQAYQATFDRMYNS